MTPKANAEPGGSARPRGMRGSWTWASACLALVLLPACTSLRRGDDAGGRPAPPPPPSFSAVTAPIDGRGGTELAMLEHSPQLDGARLRRAYILQANHEYRAALDVLNLILYGDERVDPQTEAVARWLRGKVFAADGKSEQVGYELDRAKHLTHDPALIAAIDALEADTAPPLTRPAAPRAAAIEVLPRASWHAASAIPDRLQRMGPITRITIHHSGSEVGGQGVGEAAEAIHGIQRYHQRDRGWGDIAYHFLIDPTGRIWTGRSLAWQGAHAGDADLNRGNIGICLLGNFVPSADGRPPAAEVQAMDDLVRWLCARYDIGPSEVFTHRELKETSCPGPYLQLAVEQLRARLANERIAAQP